MTTQMPDRFLCRRQPVSMIALRPRLTFSPLRDFGITTVDWITSNHRGFWCDYEIDDGLLLRNLYLKSETYPTIAGIDAAPIPFYTKLFKDNNIDASPPMQYLGLDYLVDYTGDFVVKGPSISELRFENGIIVDEVEISKENSSWWADEKHSYFYQLNYGLMGIDRHTSVAAKNADAEWDGKI